MHQTGEQGEDLDSSNLILNHIQNSQQISQAKMCYFHTKTHQVILNFLYLLLAIYLQEFSLLRIT